MIMALEPEPANTFFSMRTLITSVLLISFTAHSQNFSFRDEDIPDSVREYIINNAPPPGHYLVDVYLNDELRDSREVDFLLDNEDKIVPCLTTDYLLSLGIKNESVPDNNGCADFKKIKYSSYKFDFSSLKLKLYFPQAILVKTNKVTTTTLDYGIPALFLNYKGSTYFLRTRDKQSTSNYSFNTMSGINLGTWRYRINTYGMRSSGYSQFGITGNYLEKSLFAYKSKLVVGDTYTNSSAFGNTRLTGLQIFTDDSMSDYNEIAYKPVVSGIAQSPSRLTVRQGQYIVMSKNIPAGPFSYEVDSSIYNGSDLDVEISGDDGETRNYTLQSNSMGIMRAPGSIKYNLFAGKTADTPVTENVASAEVYYGFPLNVTGLLGVRVSNKNTSLATGFASDLGWLGGLGYNFTATDWKNKGSGTKQSLQYRKHIFDSTFFDAEYNFYHRYSEPFYPNERSQKELQKSWRINLNHSFKHAGYLSAQLEESTYNRKKSSRASISHNISFGSFSLQTSLQRNKYHERSADTIFSLNLTSSYFSPAFNASYGMISKKNETRNNINIYGQNSFDNNYINWRYQGSKSDVNDRSGSHYLSARFDNAQGNQSLSYSSSSFSDQYSASAEGGVLFHSSGVYLGKDISGTTALINTRGVSGIKVNGNRGSTDKNGYMLMQYLRPFQKNDISLNAASIPDDVSIRNLKRTVWPDGNAILLLDFAMRRGNDILYTVYGPEGNTLPFGSVATYVLKGQNLSSGIVDEDGSLYLSGLEKEGKVTIQYGEKRRCSFSVTQNDFISSSSEVKKKCQ